MGMLLRAIFGPEIITSVVLLAISVAELFYAGYLLGKERGKKNHDG